MRQLKLRAEQLTWEVVEGEIVALDLASSEYLGLNGTGAALWQRLAAGATRDELIDGLVARFDVAADQAGRDVDAFVADLGTLGLLDVTAQDARRPRVRSDGSDESSEETR
jgi:hypothetical protein